MDRFAFTSDQLTPGLTDRQRFSAWIELYNDNFGVRGDFEASSAPFQAHMEFAWVGDLILARADLTAAAGEFGGRHRATPEDEGRMGIMINTSGHAIQTKHRGREDALAPGGSMLLCRADEGRFWLGSNSASSWVLIDMTRPAVTRAAPNSEDLVGGVLSGGGEALRLASAFAALVFQEPGFADQRLDAHVSQTFFDLLALVLGAEKETAEIARGRGLRAARLDAIVQGIAKGYADPSFSVATVATRLNLSERYIQDLLRSTGVGFSERVMELRLQHSVGLLARAPEDQRGCLVFGVQRPLLLPSLLPPALRHDAGHSEGVARRSAGISNSLRRMGPAFAAGSPPFHATTRKSATETGK